MADAATPSPSAPAAASADAAAAQPAPGAAAPAQAAPQTTAPADGIPAVPARKPLPRLPGVEPDPEDDPSAFLPRPPDARTAAPQRGPDGRFLPADPARTGTPPASDADTAVEGTGPHPQEPDQGRAEKFKFGDVEFDSREAAEQNFKSLRGQYRPLMQIAREYGGVDKIPAVLGRAVESARGWHQHAQALEGQIQHLMAELEAVRSGKPVPPAGRTQPQTQNAAAPAPDAEAAEVDWGLFAEISKLANEQGEPHKAIEWLMQQNSQVMQSRLERLLAQHLAPLLAQQQQSAQTEQILAQTETLFGNLAEYTLDDGSPAFPELNSEDTAHEVGVTWANLGLDPEAALTPQGAIAAVAVYRMAKAAQSGAMPGQVTPTTPASPAPQGAAPSPTLTDALAAAGMDGGRPTTVTAGSDGSQSAEAARILAGLASANKNTRSALGFEP